MAANEESLDDLIQKKEVEKEKVEKCLRELRHSVKYLQTLFETSTTSKNQPKDNPKHAVRLSFFIKQANKNPTIEKEVIKYIEKMVDKRKFQIEASFNWKPGAANGPLVVFCNYSSRIGVDVEYSLRGVDDPQVILIVLHVCRKALIAGDLSDNDYLLSDDLKSRVAFIAHFAFDDHVYDCAQNNEQRERLCAELSKTFNS